MRKEAYFTQENIDTKANEFYESALAISGKKHLELHPRHSALLILDMQATFLSPDSPAFLPSSPPVLEKIVGFQKKCRDLGLPILLTRHGNTAADAGCMTAWWQTLTSPRDPGFEIAPSLLDGSYRVIDKTQYDAFHRTDLEILLRKNRIQSLIITGVLTNLCCETTVRSAFVKGFSPFLPIDLTAAPNERLHRATVENLAYGFTAPVLSYQLLARLGEA